MGYSTDSRSGSTATRRRTRSRVGESRSNPCPAAVSDVVAGSLFGGEPRQRAAVTTAAKREGVPWLSSPTLGSRGALGFNGGRPGLGSRAPRAGPGARRDLELPDLCLGAIQNE